MTLSPVRIAAALVTLALVAVAPREAPAAARKGPRFGIFTIGAAPGHDEAITGLREGFRLGRLDPAILERSADSRDDAAGVLAEFAFERVDAVFVVGPEAAQAARDALRDPAVVFTAVGYPDAHGLPGRGNVCGVADGVPARETLGWIRRAAPGTRRAFVVRAGPSPAANGLEEALVAGGLRTVRGDLSAAGPGDCVWLAPEVGASEADRIARSLRETGVPLFGSRRAHLDAGCSVVVRCEPRDAGLLAAALARRVLDGEAASEIGVRQVARRRLELNLEAARRIGHEIPIGIVARADHVLPALGRRE